MSSTHLRLEGPDLPTLLEEVRAEYGPGARIVHAERIRRGGVGGFFARERYHVEIEVGEVPVVGSTVISTGAGRGAAAGRPAAPRTAQRTAHDAGPGAGQGHGQRPGPASGHGTGQGLPSGPTARTVMDLVEQLNLEEHAAHQPHPAAPAPAPAGSARPGGTAPALTLAAALASSAAGGAASLSTQSASFSDVLSRLQHSVADATTPVASPFAGSLSVPPVDAPQDEEPHSFVRLGATARPVVTPAPAVARHQQPDVVPAGHAEPGPAAVRHHLPEPAATAFSQPVAVSAREVQPRHGSHSPAHRDECASLVARAVRLGVPAEVLEDVADASTVYRRLLSWVESRPPAPLMAPAPGQVIAVVGELGAAMRVARSVAFELGVDPSMIHLAVPATSSGHDVPVGRLLSDPADIAVRRHQWRHSVGSTIVVVEAALPPAARTWVSSVLSALAPTFTWAVAQASTKVADVVSWAQVIGQVDAVALENVPATGDPAASLAGPLPIGLLDGRRASVSRWMAMLTMEGGR